jgi:hypothetical protein
MAGISQGEAAGVAQHGKAKPAAMPAGSPSLAKQAVCGDSWAISWGHRQPAISISLVIRKQGAKHARPEDAETSQTTGITEQKRTGSKAACQ